MAAGYNGSMRILALLIKINKFTYIYMLYSNYNIVNIY